MIHRNAFCWCGSGKKWKNCHFPDEGAGSFETLRKRYLDRYHIIVKDEQEIAKIRRASQVTSEILMEVARAAKAGVTTKELDILAAKLCDKANATPAALHYGEPPFPGNICISLNEVVCHGIPDETVLKEGDILNIDVACIVGGYYGDCSMMVAIGEIDEEKRRVMDAAYDGLMESIKILKPGALVSDIGKRITEVAKERDCSVVDQFVAHGVGRHFHENPQIPHSLNRFDIPLVPGMTFTIEPMINGGTKEAIISKSDGWTARTKDGRPSAQWEHTLLITPSGHEILTPWKRIS